MGVTASPHLLTLAVVSVMAILMGADGISLSFWSLILLNMRTALGPLG